VRALEVCPDRVDDSGAGGVEPEDFFVVEIAGAFVLTMVVFGSYVAWMSVTDERRRRGGAFWVDTPSEAVMETCRHHVVELVERVAVVRDLRWYPLPEEYRAAA
jgi:hypothetical protein